MQINAIPLNVILNFTNLLVIVLFTADTGTFPHCRIPEQWGKVVVGYNNFPISFTKKVLSANCTDSGSTAVTYGLNIQGLSRYIAYTKNSDDTYWGYGFFIGI